MSREKRAPHAGVMCRKLMKNPTENDVQKLGPIIRVLAAFILICSIIVVAVSVFFAITETLDPLFIVTFLVAILTGHICGSVVFKGYAPKYLLFAHGPKENT